jgi:methionyl-tRNA formyltransferase
MPPRVVFMGSPDFAVPSLEALLAARERVTLSGVVTQPDKPAGRGQKLTPCEVKVAAERHGLTVLTPARMKAPETLAALEALAPELVVVAAYGRILPPALLAVPRLGCVNVHASLLPRFRGASPIAHAILAGDTDSGVCLMRMEEGLDTGPVYGRRATPILPDDTTASLSARLSRLGAQLLVELLPELLAGTLTPTPQPEAGVTYAPLLEKKDGWLDFGEPAVALERRVRAMMPWPLAFVSRAGQRVQVLAARVAEGRGDPAEVLAAGPSGVLVACGEGALLLESVKPAGKGVMTGAAWAAGRGVAAGDRLETELPEAPHA